MFGLKKIITAQQTREADAFTIEHEPVTSLDLMERASLSFADELLKDGLSDKKIAVVCGTGNNGGDGFAVARILQSKDIQVHPFLIQFKDTLSKDCLTNFNRLEDVTIVKPHDTIPDFATFDVIIDALLGSGLKRVTEGFLARVIDAVNRSGKTVYAIDIPSGLFCDTLTEASAIIKSDITVSFQRPKKAFFFPENDVYIRQWKVVNIGLNEAFIQQQMTADYILDEKIAAIIRPRRRYSHKGTYGHALILAGAYGKMGAAVLASKACLRSGAGLLTTYIPKCGYAILQTGVPEAMCITAPGEKYISSLPDIEAYQAIGIGPGLGTHTDTVAALSNLLEKSTVPLVLDADALNIISDSRELIKKIPKHSVVTPHIKEFDRLAGTSQTSLERFKKQRLFSKQNKCIVVLKDAHTSVADIDGNLFFNTSGNPGMATAGSGDVLTGVITGLLAQGYTSLEAALLGVYFHGVAGNSAAKKQGQSGLMASDIINDLRIG